jgi:hypothetical protein
MPTQKISFLKGLDKDSDIRYLQNAYRDAYNVRITDYQSGNKLTLSNVKGNTEIDYSLPDGHNIAIGSYDDKVNKNVYYFVYNSEKNHIILKYDYQANDISLVLRDTAGRDELAFSVDYYITSVALLDNRFLIYTDDNSEPRWIDLDNLSKYSDPLSSGTLLDIAKAPQDVPVLCSYSTNSEKKYNNLVGKLWQFRTVYVYNDDTRSVFSTISKSPIPTIDSQSAFTENQDVSIDNEIILSIPTPPQDVKEVEIYAQGVESDEVKTSNWYLAQTVTRQEIIDAPTTRGNNTYGDFNFANDEIYTLADPIEVTQLETFVPKKAKALDIINGNRLAMANIIDGFDVSGINLESNVSFTENEIPVASSPVGVLVYDSAPSGTNTVDASADVLTNNGIQINNSSPDVATPLSVDPTFDSMQITTTPVAFDYFQFTIRLSYIVFSNGVVLSSSTKDFDIGYIVKESDIGSNTNTNVAKGIADAINAIDTKVDGLGGIAATSVGTKVRIYQGQNVIGINGNQTAVTSCAINGSVTTTNLAEVQSLPTFKRDGLHEFAIKYSDGKGRSTTALTTPQLKGLSPSIDGLTSTGTRGRVTAQIEIYNDAPSWAESYSILYTKNQSFDDFLYFIGEITDETETNLWSVSLEDLYRFRFRNQGTPLEYTFQDGDIIQFIESVGGTYVKSDVPSMNILSEEGATTTRKIYFNYDNGAGHLTDGAKYLFEIRRPKTPSTEKFYYEIGHTYSISNGLHNGNTQDQTSSLPAIISLDDVGDAYYKRRSFVAYDKAPTPVTATTELVEDYNLSDYYDSAATSIGRASVKDDNFTEKERDTVIVYSQPYIPETNVNGISTFYGTSLEQYDTQYGSIQHIYNEGRRLFIFQENKVGQIGINEQFFLNGSQQTYQTNTVLNPIQYYPAEYGIGTSPESFAVFGYRKYFVDTLRSSVIRLSQDGLTPISDSGMRGFFNSLFGVKDNKRVRLVYNKNFDELTLSSTNENWVEDITPTNKTTTSCTVLVPKSKFPDLDSELLSTFCIYMNVSGESSTEYVVRSASVQSVTDSGDNFSLNLTFDAVSTNTYTIALLEKCNYSVLTFNEEAKAWISRWDYKPEWMEEAGIGMVSFKYGKIYLHDSNTTRGQFYGTNYPAKVKVVANENPSYPKMYKTIQQESTTQWECPNITTENGQASNLIDDDFENIQNQWYAAFLFDSNTPNVVDPLLNGDPLRDVAMEIEMQNDSTSEERIFMIGVNYIVSNLSNDE